MAEARRALVARARDLVGAHAGFAVGRLVDLERALAERQRAVRATRLEDYVARLEATATTGGEVQALAEALAVHETYFFRDPAQLAVFVDEALPERARARAGAKVRVLSAGAATGAEPYTLAILVAERRPDLAAGVQIVGVDLSRPAIRAAIAGRFSPWALRHTPPALRERWFSDEGGSFAVRPELRARVHFEQRNLVDEDVVFFAPGAFDVVFCRNVLMYLEPARAREVVARLERALAPGGWIFLGPAETLRELGTGLVTTTSRDAVVHRAPLRRASTAARAGAPAGRAQPRAAPRATAPRASTRPTVAAAVRHVPASTPPGLARAAELVERGDLAEAETACARCVAEDDLDPGAHYVLALCRERAGDAESALRHDHAAAYLDPTFAMPHVHMAVLARRAGDRASARRNLERAIDLLASEGDARIALFGGGLDREALTAICRTELGLLAGAR